MKGEVVNGITQLGWHGISDFEGSGYLVIWHQNASQPASQPVLMVVWVLSAPQLLCRSSFSRAGQHLLSRWQAAFHVVSISALTRLSLTKFRLYFKPDEISLPQVQTLWDFSLLPLKAPAVECASWGALRFSWLSRPAGWQYSRQPHATFERGYLGCFKRSLKYCRRGIKCLFRYLGRKWSYLLELGPEDCQTHF